VLEMGVPDELIRKYEWVREIEAWTVTVIKNRPVDEVVQIFGGDPAEPLGDLTFAAMDERREQGSPDIEFHLQVMRHGDVVVTMENDGYSGAFPEIARRCSAGGGSLFSVYWNIHAAGLVTQAIDGAVTARFESLFPVEPEPRGEDLRPAWAVGPEIEPRLAFQVCMVHLQQQTGVAVEREWLTEPHRTYRIPDPYRLYHDVEGADRS
jgi:hypothetical protein